MDRQRRPRPPGKTNEPSIVVVEHPDHTSVPEEMEEGLHMPDAPSGQHHRRRPDNTRSSTEPTPAFLFEGWRKNKDPLDHRPSSSGTGSTSNRHRNRSPYSRSHLRSRSSGAATLTAPLMTRAHSMPNPHMPRPFDTSTASTSLSPTPLRLPARARSPFKADDQLYNPPTRSPSWLDMGIEAIQEDSELDIAPHPSQYSASTSASASFSRSNSLRSSRRPSSPLHQSYSTSSIFTDHNHANTSSASNSPALNPQKYNEAYPTSFSLHHWASTSSFSSLSMPSTPTSARSRSPSISSLETIEDAPEQESQAEADVIERLRLAADSESDGEGEGIRRRSLDVPRGGRRIGSAIGGERKRWSICGGERRADLDLETIWED